MLDDQIWNAVWIVGGYLASIVVGLHIWQIHRLAD